MCGICGFTKKDTVPAQKALIQKMNNLLFHRGPDDEGYFYDRTVVFGHRRLSIIDLALGKQPMETNTHTIVFNGEIYNFKDLKKRLIEKGYSFQTNSDTEVLLKMYEEYKEQCLDYLDGMFAFAIWDKKHEKLFLARDRLGVKPLYYAFVQGEIVFASEIKSLLAYPGLKRKLNEKVLNSYFQYRYIIGNETFFAGIYSILPGTFLLFDRKRKKIVTREYWHLPVLAHKENKGEKYYINAIRELVSKSVERRLISDVPVGAYLSGGLDSSIVTSIMASMKRDSRVQTFTIGFKEEGFNEFPYARQVSQKWKTNHHEILLSGRQYMAEMEALIEYKDAPLAVPNEVPLYLMSKELKKYVTVVLSGEGADELFGGYGRIFRSYLEFQEDGREKYLDFFLKKYNYISDEDLQKFLSSRSMKQIQKGTYTRSIFDRELKKIETLTIQDKPLYLFQNLHLQGLLQRVDTTTMAASVEGRVPFVDDRALVEFVNGIPFDLKIKWKSKEMRKRAIKEKLGAESISENLDIPKYLLREAFRGYVPKEVLERKKVGFPVPLDRWFKGKFQNYAKEILLHKRTVERGIFNKPYITSGAWIRDLSGMNIWMMINLEVFLRKYFD